MIWYFSVGLDLPPPERLIVDDIVAGKLAGGGVHKSAPRASAQGVSCDHSPQDMEMSTFSENTNNL